MMKKGGQQLSRCERILLAAVALNAALSVWDIARYAWLGEPVSLTAICVVSVLLALAAALARECRMPLILLAVGGASIVLFSTTNYAETTMFNFAYAIRAAVCILCGLAGTALALKERLRPQLPSGVTLLAFCGVLLAAGAAWGIGTQLARRDNSPAHRQIWAVPAKYDGKSAVSEGTVERLDYETKAYATDGRTVQKTAYVYLPAGYDPAERYNVLYLLHGTGDDERYWLLTHPENKRMLDHMIADGSIAPLIVVTPTFYVEDDCMDGLDALTYTFRDELRRDLMPAAESRYSTWAESCDDAGFAASREHRAFTGLSRGAVTTLHSALCGSVDWFAWFGVFSGSRTTADYIRETLQSPGLAGYPICDLYMTSGSFDFALPGQVKDYRAMVEAEPRLTEGSNTAFDVYPVRYHSMGNWHLALYNCLQRLF